MLLFEEREYELVQKPFIEQLIKLGYQYCDPKDLEGEREGIRSVLLKPRLQNAIRRLNSQIPEGKIDEVLQEIIRKLENPAQPDLVRCNEVVHQVLVQGAHIQLDLGQGARYYTVRLVDFENPENNDFLVTDSLPRRSSFEVQGWERKIAPDILIFVNGIPLVVVETKDPCMKNKDPMEEARLQLERYQEQAPQLFYTNLFSVATIGIQCEYAPVKGKFERWRDDFVQKELERSLEREPTSQEVFIASLFPKNNLLEFLRSFVAYADEATGRVKKIARYMQWRAVNNAVNSAHEARQKGDGKGGTIWHWQGSGKTLTMLWLALKLRREFQNPCIILLTDRRELDRQITRVFQHHGYPNPIHASSINHLKELLQHPVGKTILVTLQKLGSKILSETRETEHLTEEENIFVLTDEAHRSQYALLAARMRNLLPKATFFAFTGTPLEKEERNTPAIFGDYIDRYTIMDAQRDGVTVPITYQARLPELHLNREVDVDERLALVFKDFGEEERELLEEAKRKKITQQMVAQVEGRMREIAKDIVKHFLVEIEPNGFKAIVVAHRRKMAVKYKELVDEILKEKGRRDIETAAVITVGQNEDWALPYQRSEEEEQRLINRFRDPKDPLKILFVSDKLLTGFDAPILQVMYLDKRLREHTLLQAIARVNRPCRLKRDGDEVVKEMGLVVDYFGVANELREALEKYEQRDVEGAYADFSQWIEELRKTHEEILRFFADEGVDLSKPIDFDVLQRSIQILEDEERRLKFIELVRSYGKYLNLSLPDPSALEFCDFYKRLVYIRQAAYRCYYDRRLRPKEYLPKLMEILNEAVKVGEIDLTEPAEITDESFLEQVNKDVERERGNKEQARMKVVRISNALQVYITEHLHEDPNFYLSLQEQLEEILREFKERRKEAHEIVESMLKLREEILQRKREEEALGLNVGQLSFFRFLRNQNLEIERAREIVLRLEKAIKGAIIPDWTEMPEAKQKVKVTIYRCLVKELGISREQASQWLDELVTLAKQHYQEA